MKLNAKHGVWALPAKWASLITAEPVMTGREYKERPAVTTEGVCVIDITGVILREEDELCEMFGAASTLRVSRQIKAALGDAGTKSILLHVNSPGGSVNGTAELADQIYAARQVKPVFAYVAGDCYSAAYWLASQAQTIIAHDAAGLGALGVCYPVEKDYSDWLISDSTPNKYPEIATEESRAQMQVFLNELAAIFMRHVARGRGVNENEVIAKYGRGDIFIAAQAVEKGLADSIGNFDAAFAAAKAGATVGQAEPAVEENAQGSEAAQNEITGNAQAEQSEKAEGENMQKIKAEMVDPMDITVEWLETNLPELIEQIKQKAADEESARQAEFDAMAPADEEEMVAVAAARKDRKITAAKLAYDLRLKAQAKAKAVAEAARAAREADSQAVVIPTNPPGGETPEQIAERKRSEGIIAAMKKRRGMA